MWIRLLLALTLTGCASNRLLRSTDYENSRALLLKAQPQESRNQFPSKFERGGFLTTVESGYLNLLSHQAQPEPLVQISDQLEKREVISVSNEVGNFFYQQSEDGYLPAEHEVIWLHLIAGLSYAAQNRPEPARVEAQRAAQLLQGHYSERTGEFDDPGLRLILAGLWIYCGEWQHARVDLRRAGEMDARYLWAKKLADQDLAPKNLQIIFAGVGPEPEWQPTTAKATLTGLESLKFKVDESRDHVTLVDVIGRPQTITAPISSNQWYVRHQKRNYQIRDVVDGSKYFAKAAGQTAYTGTGMALTKGAAATIVAVAVGVGAAIVVGAIALLSQSGGSVSSETLGQLAGLGVGVGTYGVEKASKFDQRNMDSLKKDWNKSMSPATNYRYMRFLPDQIFAASISAANLLIENPNGLTSAPYLTLSSPDHQSIVNFYFVN